MATRNPKYTATGAITDANGLPVEGAPVELLLVNLRQEDLLGRAVTDAAGAYGISYSPPDARPLPDVQLRVLDADGRPAAVSPVLYRAPLHAVIDLALPAHDAGKSALTRLTSRVQPLIGEVPLAELSESGERRDISRLSAATGESPARIARLRAAHRLAASTGLSADLHFAWLEAGLPEEPDRLVTIPADQLDAALRTAGDRGLIDRSDDETRRKAVRQLKGSAIPQPLGLVRQEVYFQPVSRLPAAESDYAHEVLSRNLRRIILETLPPVGLPTRQKIEARLSGIDYRDHPDALLSEVIFRSILPAPPPDGSGWPPVDLDDDECAILQHYAARPTVRQELQPDTPLHAHPFFIEALGRVKTFEYTALAGVNAPEAVALLEHGLTAVNWSDEALRPLVEESAISAETASALARLGALSRLSGGHPGFVKVLHDTAPANLADLAAFAPSDWQALIDRNQIVLPTGETPASFAQTLAANLELAYPVAYFLHHRLGQEPSGSPARLFHQNNPSDAWLSHDWAQGDHAVFQWTGIADENRPQVRRQLAADQRIFRVAETAGQAVTLRDKGFDSARSMVRYSLKDFTAASGLPEAAASRAYARAREINTQTMHAYGAVQDLVTGGLGKTRVGNVAKETVNELLKIEGMSRLFGPQQFCSCRECRSVLSPAAYLVDMLRFTGHYIEEKLSAAPATLRLSHRRPDLLTLPLSCANTNTQVPYVTLVNEILAAWVAQHEQKDVFEEVLKPENGRGFLLPFSGPLAELRLYLSHFNLSLFELVAWLGNPSGKLQDIPGETWLEYLELDPAMAVLITTPAADAQVLERYCIDALMELTPAYLMRLAGLDRATLSALLDMRFNDALQNVKIELIKDEAADDIQAYREAFSGITLQHADYLYRLIRLWRKTRWSVPELDQVLRSLPGADQNLAQPELLVQVAQAAFVQARFGWNVQVLCTFLDKIPVSTAFPVPPESPEERGLLEQVFDLEALFGLDQQGHYQEETPYDIQNPDDAHRRLTALLLTGLNLTEPELTALIAYLGDDWPKKLDRQSLSTLYRHVLMARTLGWSLGEWLIAASLLDQKDVRGLDNLIKLLDFNPWQQALSLLPSEMAFFLGKTTILDGQEYVFSLQSKEVTTALEAVVKAGANESEPEAKLAARKTAFANTAQLFQATLNAGPDFWNALLQWTPTDLTPYWSDGTSEPPTLPMLTQWATEVERVLWLARRLGWSEQVFIWITEHPAKLKIGNRRLRNLALLEHLSAWQQLAPEAPEDVAAALDALAAQNDFGTPANEAYLALANWWKAEPAVLLETKALLALPEKITVPIVLRLQGTLALGKRLGASAGLLGQLVQLDTYDKAKTAAEIALQLVQSGYKDEKERVARIEPYTDKVNAWRRDALVQYMLTRYKSDFPDENSLYAYFLLDVEMGACFRTSRIVAAHGSIQLYVHRILMNLEQTLDPAVSVLNVLENLDDFKTEWEWRKNYRVWEANRKVFLYPENYLEPDLRDDKTPIFRELEEELLQQEFSQEAAELAWRNYFAKYTELAELRIAGSFYEKEKNTYHFFGRTVKDPYQYYYRRWENQRRWTPWEAMELPITAKGVTGIVHLGQLYVFWAEVETEQNDEKETIYKIFLSLSYRKANGRWSTPQRLEFHTLSDSILPGFIAEVIPVTYFTYCQLLSTEGLYEVKIFPNASTKALGFTMGYREVAFMELGNQTSPQEVVYKKIEKIYSSSANSFQDYTAIVPHGNDGFAGGGDDKPKTRLIGFSGDMEDVLVATDGIRFFASHLVSVSIEDNFPENTREFWTNSPNPDLLQNAIELSQLIQSTAHKLIQKIGLTEEEQILLLADQQYLIRTWSSAPASVSVPNLPTSISLYTATITKSVSHSALRLTPYPEKNYPSVLAENGIAHFLGTSVQAIPESPFPVHLTSGGPAYFKQPVVPKGMDLTGSYGTYLRELFFHTPFLIAHQMNANQRFKEAKWWYERIFDPAASGSAGDIDRPWRYIEFRGLGYAKMKDALQDGAALELYRLDPFNPHAIARLRLSAYQKTIVMKYVDNLIDWGDQLFARDTMESVNEALALYVLARDILGEKPEPLGLCKEPEETALSYEKITQQDPEKWDSWLWLESAVQSTLPDPGLPDSGPFPWNDIELVFCIPDNKDLLEYWNRVADRLYKIRHCLNLQGQRRQLALFAPPIDPMLLVRAKALGLSIEQALAMAYEVVPHYRFTYLVERAKQYAQMVQSFGSALLSALNGKDAEQLSLLRSVQEREILRLGREVRKRNLEEAKAQAKSVLENEINVRQRQKYFEDLLNEGNIKEENNEDILRQIIKWTRVVESGFHVSSAFAGLGDKWSEKLRSLGLATGAAAGSLEGFALGLNVRASRFRRKEEWIFQKKTAEQELKQTAQQLLAAEIRVAIAEKDLEMHEKSMEQADELFHFYRDKFTNLGLYNYMARTLHTLHRQAYNLAYETALKAQKALEYEKEAVDIIRPDNWAGDRAGLLSGERLTLQLQQLERAYEEKNTRELELTKHISLAQVAPEALLTLKNKGECGITLPEWLFDLDFPGHYLRRIKSVSLSIPCIAGPYTSINATLRLGENSIRIDTRDGDNGYPRNPTGLDDRFITQTVPVKAIATSSAQGDSGLFELNFRDERYLPFEGAGVESQWTLEMPRENNQFDFETITDVIMHLRYTAREGGEAFKKAVNTDLEDIFKNTVLLVNLRQEFSTEWYRFLHDEQGEQSLIADLKTRLPFIARDKTVIKVSRIDFFAALSAEPTDVYTLNVEPFTAAEVSLGRNDPGLYHTASIPLSPARGLATLKLTIRKNGSQLGPDDLKEMFVLLRLEL